MPPRSWARRQARGEIHVSVRPQSIALLRQEPAASDRQFCMSGTIRRRAYLGEYWDYYVAVPGLESDLRVTARPQDVFALNERVFLGIDPDQLTVIS